MLDKWFSQGHRAPGTDRVLGRRIQLPPGHIMPNATEDRMLVDDCGQKSLDQGLVVSRCASG
ncbi:MAG: hypothetical protein J2P13_08150 [Acidobacteria bacterium]|nr:hypothetical protein [Acidobacteriota bacterium]